MGADESKWACGMRACGLACVRADVHACRTTAAVLGLLASFWLVFCVLGRCFGSWVGGCFGFLVGVWGFVCYSLALNIMFGVSSRMFGWCG